MKRSIIGFFGLGVASLSFIMGLFIGASNSPVTGILFTGLFGILAPLVSFFTAKKEEKKGQPPAPVDLNAIGFLMAVFSIFVFLGAFAGERYRNYEGLSGKYLIWGSKEPPRSTYEALDWIAVTEFLTAKGYSKSQLDSLYDVRLRELHDTAYSSDQNSLKYSESTPYSRMIEKVPQKEIKRGPASE